MNAYALLAGAIACEIVATLSLKAADGFSRPLPSIVVVIGYAASFTLLGFALARGLNVGVGYAIWSGVGTTVVAILGVLIFRDTLSANAIGGIVLIVAGVVLLNIGHGGNPEESASPGGASVGAPVGAAPHGDA
ncbi:DMT family transporter [Rhodococcus oryzae]|uniref:DMT family transporter n=1 Tax=Rhodococcus oryzae TaxID=2571143 RepID=UPI0037A6AAF8